MFFVFSKTEHYVFIDPSPHSGLIALIKLAIFAFTECVPSVSAFPQFSVISIENTRGGMKVEPAATDITRVLYIADFRDRIYLSSYKTLLKNSLRIFLLK